MADNDTPSTEAAMDDQPQRAIDKYKRSDDGRVIYPLQKPFEFGEGNLIKELRFREPETGDIAGIPLNAMTTTHLIGIASKMCGQPMPIMNKVKLVDALEIMAIVADFLPPGLLTGLMN